MSSKDNYSVKAVQVLMCVCVCVLCVCVCVCRTLHFIVNSQEVRLDFQEQ